MRFGGRGAAIGGGSIVVVLLAMLLGIDPRAIMVGLDDGTSQVPQVPTGTPTDEQGQFMATVYADLEDTWKGIFGQSGDSFRPPTLVLFTEATPTECGYGQAAMGPFYCPLDEKIYIDLAFYDELDKRFGAPGDFAQAYVLAHEMGHHVQKVLGIMDRIRQMSGGLSESDTRALSVRQELQADCLAGV
ncbi:MAG TPA: neutral zinc metallopeptidase, partial [Candidatus Eisenbacteria bacterium]|nr:neutral zinc metallopeptidase [Candidatus Eisenbacteria bacterium]